MCMGTLCLLFTGAAPLPSPIDGGHIASKKKLSDHENSTSTLSPRSRPVPILGENIAHAFTRALSAGPPPYKSWPDDCENCFIFTRSFSATPGHSSTRRRLSDGQPRRVELPSEQFTRCPSHSTRPRSPTSRKKKLSSGTAFFLLENCCTTSTGRVHCTRNKRKRRNLRKM